MKFSKLSKILTVVLLISVLAVSLIACSTSKDNKDEEQSTDSSISTLMATEPDSADEASKLYNQLMEKENEILSTDTELWNKVFLASNKNSKMIEDGTNYGDFLLTTIESAKDQFTDEEYKKLVAGAEQIKEIEGKLTILEQKYPECANAPSNGDSVPADSAGVVSDSGDATSFPSFNGKDLDGNDVKSSDLFSNSNVTVVNYWFSTCKPCVGELPELEKLNKELAEKGGQVVGINTFTLDGDKTAISEAKDILSKKGITYKNIWFDSNSDAGKFTSSIFSFPTTYVVDKNGNIVGEPIVGAITENKQKKTLEKLIDQALQVK